MLKDITAVHNFGESDVGVALTACGQSSAKTSNGNDAFVPMGSSAILVHYQPAVLDSGLHSDTCTASTSHALSVVLRDVGAGKSFAKQF